MPTAQVYLDNASTTPLDPKVIDCILEMLPEFGNPSSTHSTGRSAKAVLETARRKVAEIMGVLPGEIVFTSGGTEADNLAIKGAVKSLAVERVISSPLEHHAVLHTIESLPDSVERKWLTVDSQGIFSIDQLEELLKINTPTLVSLMHGNNEIGNLLDFEAVGELCRRYGAFFHSDCVQTVGHYPINCKDVHFLAASAHKFHGPKGIGFAVVKKECKLSPLIEGGGQERGFRSGTENVVFVAAMVRALEIAVEGIESHQSKIIKLKNLMIEGLLEIFGNDVWFNGMSHTDRSLYTVLNVSLPAKAMFLFSLDMNGVAASGGSACSSGASAGSHVLAAINASDTRANVRFSFSRFNSEADVEHCLNAVAQIYGLKRNLVPQR